MAVCNLGRSSSRTFYSKIFHVNRCPPAQRSIRDVKHPRRLCADVLLRSTTGCFPCCHHTPPNGEGSKSSDDVPDPPSPANLSCVADGDASGCHSCPADLMETCISPVRVCVERCSSSTLAGCESMPVDAKHPRDQKKTCRLLRLCLLCEQTRLLHSENGDALLRECTECFSLAQRKRREDRTDAAACMATWRLTQELTGGP